MVRPHIESSAFFLKSRKGRVTRAASGPFLSWLSPGLCLGPHSFCPNILSPKKNKNKGVYTTKRSVETVPSVSLCRASGSPSDRPGPSDQVLGHIPLKESISDSKTLSSTLGPVIPAPIR